MTHSAVVLSQQQSEALDWACVGVWGTIVQGPVLTRGATTAAASSRAQSGASVVPTVGGSRCRILYTPSPRRPLGVTGEEQCPEVGGGWAAQVPAMADFFPSGT